jgi:FtsP/CotA-like multicopper oxidase with cupredoxin domain
MSIILTRIISLLIISLFLIVNHAMAGNPITLIVKEQEIKVKGRSAKVFRVEQPDGTWGIRAEEGENLNIMVENKISDPLAMHWHGIILPNSQDGVPGITQELIKADEKYNYNFELKQNGTYWMHSHSDMLLQQQLSAPFIIEKNNKPEDEQEVVMLISDFSFKSPEEIWRGLRKNIAHSSDVGDMKMDGMVGMDMSMSKSDSSSFHSSHDMSNMDMSGHDLNDVAYDAYLVNYKESTNPDVITVQPKKKVLLRTINAASASNFFINLGELKGNAIAVDGEDIIPLTGSLFELAMGQRIDIRLELPTNGNTYPILVQGEGTDMQSGLILTTSNVKPPMLSDKAITTAKALGYNQELQLHAANPLPNKPIKRTINIDLEGDMTSYIWKLGGKASPDMASWTIKEGERVEMVFNNKSGMSHPMHLHGHVFQVTEIDGKAINGALRDTVLVAPNSVVKVQFDANNPGIWMMHCHILYHEMGGMMATINYEGYKPELKKTD